MLVLALIVAFLWGQQEDNIEAYNLEALHALFVTHRRPLIGVKVLRGSHPLLLGALHDAGVAAAMPVPAHKVVLASLHVLPLERGE